MLKKTPKKMSAGLILVVVLATSLVLTNMLVFSASAIAKKTDDFMVRLENIGYTGDDGETDVINNIITFATRIIVDTDDSMVLENIGYTGDGSETDEESLNLISDHTIASANITKSGKAVILVFDDGWASQYSHARPILDKYGFKATFFIVCNYVGNDSYMTWREIKDLQLSGHDIESHSMAHKILTMLSAEELDYEVRQSKQCLFEHGIDSSIFATPYNAGWQNEEVIDAISKYYDFAKNGNGPLTYLHCDGLPKSVSNQTDCRTYSSTDSSEKKLNLMNRYSIRTWSHNYYDELHSHNDTRTFEEFIKEVNLPYKDTGQPASQGSTFSATTIPVLEYHKVDKSDSPTSTSPALFDAEMRYLRENGFTVLTMDDFGYEEQKNYLIVNYPRTE